MSKKQYFALLATLVVLQLFSILFFSNRTPAVAKTIHVPVPNWEKTTNVQPSFSTLALKLPNESVLRQTVRTILEQEVHAYFKELQEHTSTCGQSASVSVKANVVDAESSQLALTQSHEIIDQALMNGIWASTDELRFIAMAYKLTAAQRRELRDKFYDALERGVLRIENHGIPNF